MKRLFSFLGTGRANARPASAVTRFRPTLESLEGRVVMSATMAAPALAPALVSAAPLIQQASSLLPITIESVEITGVVDNALQLVANATTAGGQTFEIPFTLVNTTPGATTPILELEIGAIHLDLLGLQVDTSDICLAITAESGPGNLLGNLLGNVAGLLDQGLTLDQILGSLSADQLDDLNTGLTDLLNGAFDAIGSTSNASAGNTSVTTTATTQILHLSLGPVDLDLLGLHVHLDNCDDGPVTVDITAESGPGNLLGNLLGGLAHLLDSNAAGNALLNKLNKIAGKIGSLV